MTRRHLSRKFKSFLMTAICIFILSAQAFSQQTAKTADVGLLNGKAVNLVKAAYPASAAASGASGAVRVNVIVDESGNVISAEAVSNNLPLLEASAVIAARSSKFEPYKLFGQSFRMSGFLVYNFIAPAGKPAPTTKPSSSAAELIESAKASIAKKEYDSAIKDLTEAIRIEPNNSNAYAQRSRAYFLSQKTDEALADAEKALNINSKDVEALNMRGLVKRLREQNDAAIEDFSLAIVIDPSFTKAYMNRGELWLIKREYAKAADDSSTLIKLDAKIDPAYVMHGRALRFLKQYDAAINDFTKAIELNPKNEQAYYFRGLTTESKPNADWKAALADFKKATELNPSYAAAYRGQASVYNVFANDFQQGSLAATQALLINPNDSDAYTQRGYARIMMKDWQGTIDDYTQAIKFGDNDPSSYIARAQAYYNLKNYSAAAADLRKAVELNPNDQESKQNLEAITKLAQQNPSGNVTAQPTAEAEAEYKRYEAELSGLSDQRKEKSNALKEQALVSKDVPALCRMNAEVTSILSKMDALAVKMENMLETGKVDDNPSKNSLIIGRKTLIHASLFDIHNNQGKAKDFDQKQGCSTNK